MDTIYDVLIIGGGPAGLTAGLYAGRAKLTAAIIEKGQDGGQIALTNDVENYPGCNPEGESGVELIKRFSRQAERFGVVRYADTVVSVALEDEIKIVNGHDGQYRARTVVIANGAYPRKLGCPGEQEFTGKGVSYCATCDGNFFEDLEVYVVGGGDSAVEEAMYLTNFARKVTIIQQFPYLTAAKTIQERAKRNNKIEYLLGYEVQSLEGDGLLQKLTVKNMETGELTTLEADEDDGMFGCFVFIGSIPETGIYQGQITLTERGYIPTDEDMRTNLPGVFAAGDLRDKSVRQVVTAAADGCIAAMQAEKYLAELS